MSEDERVEAAASSTDERRRARLAEASTPRTSTGSSCWPATAASSLGSGSLWSAMPTASGVDGDEEATALSRQLGEPTWQILESAFDTLKSKRDRGELTPEQVEEFDAYMQTMRSQAAQWAADDERERRKDDLRAAIAAEEEAARKAAVEAQARNVRLAELQRELQAI